MVWTIIRRIIVPGKVRERSRYDVISYFCCCTENLTRFQSYPYSKVLLADDFGSPRNPADYGVPGITFYFVVAGVSARCNDRY